MAKLIRDIIDEYSEAEFTLAKLELIVNTYHQFIVKNDNHIAFFGGNYIGVYPIRFREEDRVIMVEDICEIIDFEGLRDDVHDVKEVDKRRHISGNPLNYLYIWLMYKIYNTKHPVKAKEKAIHAVMNLLQIKYLTGLDAHYFEHPADETIAHAVYESLSRKSLIKQYGSWKGVIEKRSEDLTGERSVWFDVVTSMDSNKRAVEMVNDIQGRVRKGYGNISRQFYDLREREAKIIYSKAFVTVDGERTMREYENNLEKFQSQISDIMLDPNDLIKNELIGETLSLVNAATESNLVNTLEFISENITSKKKNDMMPQIRDLTIYIFEFIKRAGLEPGDIQGIIMRLRSVYRSHKSSHAAVVEIKEQLDYVVPKAIKARHAATRSATKVAVLVYITLRVLSIPYYNG